MSLMRFIDIHSVLKDHWTELINFQWITLQVVFTCVKKQDRVTDVTARLGELFYIIWWIKFVLTQTSINGTLLERIL